MFRTLVNTQFSRQCARQFTTSSTRQVKKDITKIKLKQAVFQTNNDIPVYIKGGAGDKVLYYTTLVLTLGGTALSLHSIYKLAVNK